jgi:hypothetical protein
MKAGFKSSEEKKTEILKVGRLKFHCGEPTLTPPEELVSTQTESNFGLSKLILLKEGAVKSLVSR